MGCSKSSSKKEVNSNTSLPQEIRKTSNKQPNLTPKWATETNKQTNKTNSQRKEIIKIRVEVNKIETKKKKRSMKIKAGYLKR